MLEILREYDWREVFKPDYATPERCKRTKHSKVIFSDVSDARFTAEDVQTIYGLAWGENDGANWLMAGQLSDGRFFSISAGCDYTGWG